MALATAVVIWAILSTWTAIEQQRDEHSKLALASSAVRPLFAGADAAHVRTALDSLRDSLATWQVAAAAFDADGNFVGGDGRLRGDGLAAGRDAAPPTGRQLSIVTTRNGYVLLIRDPNSIARFRFFIALQLLVAISVALTLAWAFGTPWATARARVIGRARDDYRAIAAGETRPAAPFGTDPLFGDVFHAAETAIDRLVRAVRERAESEDRLRTFLADAGHELRTPLAIAVGYLGILKRGAVSDPELAERIIRDVSLEHERLTRLVEHILHLARLDAVPGDAGASSDVGRIALEAVALVRPLDLDCRIACEAKPTAPAAIGSDDLRDALRNLLENAIRHAPGAPIAISIATEGDEIVTRVRDDGPGMDAFTLAHAFDRFFRGPDRGEVHGTGLGLAIVRRIVERAGGNVRLQSASGRGTEVEIRLPRADLIPVNVDR
jgi:two-component system OmpR family sensor kinase